MGNTHRQSKKALTPLQKGGHISNQPVNNQLPEFPFKRVDSDLLHSETDMGLSNISLIPEEIMVRSRGSGTTGSERPRNKNENIINKNDEENNSNNGHEIHSYKKSRSITDQDDESVPTINSVSKFLFSCNFILLFLINSHYLFLFISLIYSHHYKHPHIKELMN